MPKICKLMWAAGALLALLLTSPSEAVEYGNGLRRHWMFADNYSKDGSNLTSFNHGGYGATPIEVFEAQSGYQVEMEADISTWMNGEGGYRTKIGEVRQLMASFLNCDVDDLVLVDNASNAINILLARLGFASDPFDASSGAQSQPSVLLDLSTVYGPFAGFYSWLEAARGVEVVTVDVQFPSTSEQVVDAVTATLSSRAAAGLQMPTVAVVSQVSSCPAVVMPIGRLTELFHSYGIPIIVDGAHALGNIPLDLGDPTGELANVDFWFGNAHKWLMAPKSVAVVYVRKDHHSGEIFPQPTVVDSFGDTFTDRFVWDGTRDRSPFVAVKDAIEFRNSVLGGEAAIMTYNHELARWAGDYLSQLWNTTTLTAEPSMMNSMVNVEVPTKNATLCSSVLGAIKVNHGLYTVNCGVDEDHGDIPCFVRLSAQVYLEKADFERLGDLVLDALAEEEWGARGGAR